MWHQLRDLNDAVLKLVWMDERRIRSCWIRLLWVNWTFKTSIKESLEAQVSLQMGWDIFFFANFFRLCSNASPLPPFPKSALPREARWRGAPSLILTEMVRDKDAAAHQKWASRSRGQSLCTWAAWTLKKRLTLEKLGSYWSARHGERLRTQQAAHVRATDHCYEFERD